MARLTANQESFIKLMGKSDEHARRGFELLLARPGFETFFDALDEAGMFAPANNPPRFPLMNLGIVESPIGLHWIIFRGAPSWPANAMTHCSRAKC